MTPTNKSLFLGLFQRRYLRSFAGLAHGLASLVALASGNWMFVLRIILRIDTGYGATLMNKVFIISTAMSAIVTLVFFWNKVQAWQLSTTSMKEKGLTPQILMRLNQGRGVLSMLLYSIFPLVCEYVPTSLLSDKTFSTLVAISMIGLSWRVKLHVRDYSKALFLLYGMPSMFAGLSIIWTGRSIQDMNEKYPGTLAQTQKDAYFVVTCTQFGFMLYYLYSRRLVTDTLVKNACKLYHPLLGTLFLLDIYRSIWHGGYWSQLAPPTRVVMGILCVAVPLKITPHLIRRLVEIAGDMTSTTATTSPLITKNGLVGSDTTPATVPRRNSSKRLYQAAFHQN